MTCVIPTVSEMDYCEDLEMRELKQLYQAAYRAEVSAEKQAALTEGYNAQQHAIRERIHYEWWQNIQAETEFKHHLPIGKLTEDKLIECIGLLKDQPFSGKFGVGSDVNRALPYVVRDAAGHWGACKRKETHQRLMWACHDVSVFFSNLSDFLVFKLSWLGATPR